jgi:hypothetical protein
VGNLVDAIQSSRHMENGACPGVVDDHFGMWVLQRRDAISNGFVVFKIVQDRSVWRYRRALFGFLLRWASRRESS